MRRVGIALIVAGLIVGCGTEEPELSKEKVIFNTAIITLVPDGVQKTIELIYKDLDLDGNAEVVSQAVLKPNTSYSASLKLLNEVGGNIDDVTNEILLNFSAYTMCYETGTLGMAIQRTDDIGSDVLGLTSSWVTFDASEGSVGLIIAYQPDVTDVNCAVGEKQVEVYFPINVRLGDSPN